MFYARWAMELLAKQKSQKAGSQLCVVICGPTINEAREQVKKASARADLLEFRIDQFHFSHLGSIASIKDSTNLPVIFTLRKRSQGGEFSGDEQERLQMIRQLAALQPAYLDLEYDLHDHFDEIKEISPDTKLICSYHDFEHTPKDLYSILEVMRHECVSIYKIAAIAYSTVDAMRMLRFVRDTRKKGIQIVGTSMGEYGVPTRILGPVYGSAITYATVSDIHKTAPGQLTADELLQRYHYKKLNQETEVYGLIGDPVIKSPSHLTHNFVFGKLGKNAVYVKFNVKPSELHEFMEIAKKLNFSGLSVTMPLKEIVIRELTERSDDASNIGAINTLKINNKTVIGLNTDGVGALNAIENVMSVNGKRMVILGAGGAAKAIAWEARKRGASLVILNRTVEKAVDLAGNLGGIAGGLDDFFNVAKEGYDILINCTSLGMYSEKANFPLDCSYMLHKRVVMDVIPGNRDTCFLQEARKKECLIIYGQEMLKYQAIKQALAWYGDETDEGRLQELFEEAFKAAFPPIDNIAKLGFCQKESSRGYTEVNSKLRF